MFSAVELRCRVLHHGRLDPLGHSASQMEQNCKSYLKLGSAWQHAFGTPQFANADAQRAMTCTNAS